jgi:hypothetical protein
MTTLLFFHQARGKTTGFLAFVDELRDDKERTLASLYRVG